MNKQIIHKFGKHYLLGIDKDGIKHYLDDPSFDCGWYWGFGYIHTFTNNRNPVASRDISSHYHFDSFGKDKCMYDGIKEKFTELTVSDKELWTLCELMKTAYIMRSYSDMLHSGGAHYTTNPIKEEIKNSDEYNRINHELLPKIFEEVEKILTPEKGE